MTMRALLCVALMSASGCGGGGIATTPQRDVAYATSPVEVARIDDAEALHPIDFSHPGVTPFGRADPGRAVWMPEVDTFRRARGMRAPQSSAGPADHEDAGIGTYGGGPYTGVEALHSVNVSSVDVVRPANDDGEQTLYAPTLKGPNGGCLEAGTVYLNVGSEVPPQFYVFDFCTSPASFTYLTVIDAAWVHKYVRKTYTRLPSYDVANGTYDRTVSASSHWLVALYNFDARHWDIVYEERGRYADPGAWSIFEFYYQPGRCPPLPPFGASYLSYFNGSTGAWEPVRPVMSGGMTTNVAAGPPGNCFVGDATGGASYVLHVLQQNTEWRVTSTGT